MELITEHASLIGVNDWRNGYIAVARTIAARGVEVPSQHGLTRELRNVTVVLANPYDAVPVGINRGYSPTLVSLESAMIVGGFMDDQLMVKLVPSMSAFTEDNGKFWGSYGLRLKNQLPLVLNKLRSDPDTRQAIATLWEPKLDAEGGRKDHPCTVMLHFMVRNRQLQLHTYMRSNDITWGAAHDFAQFTCLQLTMANLLGIPPGPYIHTAGSLHMYETRRNPATGEFEASSDRDIIEALTPAETSEPPMLLAGFGWLGTAWSSAARQAKAVVRRERADRNWSPTMKWYHDKIASRKELIGA